MWGGGAKFPPRKNPPYPIPKKKTSSTPKKNKQKGCTVVRGREGRQGTFGGAKGSREKPPCSLQGKGGTAQRSQRELAGSRRVREPYPTGKEKNLRKKTSPRKKSMTKISRKRNAPAGAAITPEDKDNTPTGRAPVRKTTGLGEKGGNMRTGGESSRIKKSISSKTNDSWIIRSINKRTTPSDRTHRGSNGQRGTVQGTYRGSPSTKKGHLTSLSLQAQTGKNGLHTAPRVSCRLSLG